MGLYGSLIFIGTRGGGKKKEAPAPVAAPPSSATTEVVSVFDDGFDEWSKIPGNLDKWAASFEKI